ncbi:Uncharacterised protein g8176 [Pycnogonum litorale]
MQLRWALITLYLICQITDIFALKRPDLMSFYKKRAKLSKSSEKFRITNKSAVKQHDETMKMPKYSMSSKRCCKLGEKSAELGLGCVLGPVPYSRRRNSIHRALMKYQYDRSPRKTFSVVQAISMKARKCYVHKGRFEKCCNFQRRNPKTPDKCRRLHGAAIRRCLQTFQPK